MKRNVSCKDTSDDAKGKGREKRGERPNPDSPTFFLFFADIHPLEKEEEKEERRRKRRLSIFFTWKVEVTDS